MGRVLYVEIWESIGMARVLGAAARMAMRRRGSRFFMVSGKQGDEQPEVS